MREQVELLEHHADFAADRLDVLDVRGQLDPSDDDLTSLVLFQSVDAADHRRLAGARRPADDDTLSLLDLEIEVPKDVEIAEPFVDVTQLDDWRANASFSPTAGHTALPASSAACSC